MRIPLDPHSRTPLHHQVEEYLRQAINSGSLTAGTRLPATRQLAADLGVSRATIEAAYADLRADGLIASRMGSGNYVLAPAKLKLGRRVPNADGPTDTLEWSAWQRSLREAAAESQPMASGPPAGSPAADFIDLAAGTGDPALFPVDDFRRVLHNVMRRDGGRAVDYGDYRGYAPLRRTIAGLLSASSGMVADPDEILITAGSQQAIALATGTLTVPGDTVITESPTYARALELFRALGLRIVGVPVDGQGMDVDALERLLADLAAAGVQPKLVYTMPNFHNPTGACLSPERRGRLLALAIEHNLAVLEDDYAGDLRYDGRSQPALAAIDPGGMVLHTSTFAKMLMPGLRVGFLHAAGPVYDLLLRRKAATDLATSNLMQRAVEAYVSVGRYGEHLQRSRRLYRRRRDAMLTAIRTHLPSEALVSPPLGGLFLWVRLPGGLTAGGLLPVAAAHGVGFAAGDGFCPDPRDGEGYVRLNFAAHPPERVTEGVRRLGLAIEDLRCQSL